MPIMGGGGGGGAAFNGGTITTALDVETATEPALTAHVTAGFNKKAIQAKANGVIVEALADGGASARLTADASQGMLALDLAGVADSLFLNCVDGAATLLTLDNSGVLTLTPRFNSTPLVIRDNSAALAITVLPTGQLSLWTNAAPTNTALSPGQCTLWFDDTNGASKLMVKAKSADGTVVTGSLALA